MKNKIEQQLLTGERALFQGRDLAIYYSTFADGESPLKESRNINLYHSLFQWKYPLWYSKDIVLQNCTLFEMARAGIWYTENIALTDCVVDAPKNFRHSSGITLKNVTFSNAGETLWNCSRIRMEHVTARGDYFAMNSSDIEIDGFTLTGNYSFDGAKNVVIRNARMLSKDAFWNCENVTVYDSFISGQYLGWNAKNVTFVGCTIESEQGMCYMDNIVLQDCRLLNTDLAFEYATVDATILNSVDSVKNPIAGRIAARQIKELIFDDPQIKREKTAITLAVQPQDLAG